MIAFVGSDDPTTRRLLETILMKEEEHAEGPGQSSEVTSSAT